MHWTRPDDDNGDDDNGDDDEVAAQLCVELDLMMLMLMMKVLSSGTQNPHHHQHHHQTTFDEILIFQGQHILEVLRFEAFFTYHLTHENQLLTTLATFEIFELAIVEVHDIARRLAHLVVESALLLQQDKP